MLFVAITQSYVECHRSSVFPVGNGTMSLAQPNVFLPLYALLEALRLDVTLNRAKLQDARESRMQPV